MSIFGRKWNDRSGWQDQARALVASVVRFLRDRPGGKLPPDQWALEKKLVFLLDDVRRAVRAKDRDTYDRLAGEIDLAWLDLWELRRGGFKHGK